MTITKEGALASFYTVNKAPIKHLRVYFSPKQAGEGDPSPENVRDIDGINYITIFSKGTSIVDFTDRAVIRWYVPENFLEKEVIYWGLIDNTLGTTTVKLSLRLRDANNVSLGTYYSTQTVAPGECKNIWAIFKITTQTNSIQFSVSNATSNTIIKERGLWLYNSEDHVTIDFDSFMYGGYVDLITGELVETWGNVDLGTINTWYVQTYENAKWFRATLPNEVWQNTWRPNVTSSLNNHPPHFLIDRFKIVSGSSIYYDTSGDNVLGMDWLATIRIKCDLYNDDIDAFKAAMNGVILYYEYATPITHQLTSAQLQTLIGQNNIWSNADRVEIEYDLAESNDELYRRRNIILNTPHIETAAGSIASFKTDMQAPLKECKVHFAPVQAGSGTPAPDNVREITGWTNLGIMHKNGLPSEYQAVEYLQSTGTQFITGYFKPTTTGVITLKVILEPESMTNNLWYCGGRSNGHLSMQVGRYTGTWYKDNNSDVYEVISATNGIEKIFCSKSSNTSSSYDYLLFGRAWDGSFPYSCKIFQCTLYFNDTPIYNYIPCYRKIDNVAGMYDTVNDAFYTNEGTGTFIIGQDIQVLPQPLLFKSTYSVDWGSTFGTIYGGYVDLVKGELVQEYAAFHAKDKKWYNYSSYVVFYMQTNIGRSKSSKDISDKLIPWQGYDFTKAPDNSLLSGQRSEFFIKHKGVTSDAEFNAWLAEVDPIICYKLTEPIHYSLAPQQLKTLRATNNIWANTNGPVEIKYWTH